ncbi:unnamed protein product [Closterium sp. NIES-54]
MLEGKHRAVACEVIDDQQKIAFSVWATHGGGAPHVHVQRLLKSSGRRKRGGVRSSALPPLDTGSARWGKRRREREQGLREPRDKETPVHMMNTLKGGMTKTVVQEEGQSPTNVAATAIHPQNHLLHRLYNQTQLYVLPYLGHHPRQLHLECHPHPTTTPTTSTTLATSTATATPTATIISATHTTPTLPMSTPTAVPPARSRRSTNLLRTEEVATIWNC